ncbi:hypothetical protein KR215_010482, partial [Drosophila sulfurigaster]
VSFSMFFRLFIIMGVIWILDIINYIAQIYQIKIQIFDVITCSQGVILFVATILKKDILKSLANR